MTKDQSGDPQTHPTDPFKLVDKNEDGKVSLEEFKSKLAGWH
jgi:Ca2+-binding EF-hand superfamily protein